MFAFTMPGRDWNEDCVYVCEDFGFVLDGETTIVKQNFSGMASDAQWCSNWWAKYLENNLTDMTRNIPDILRSGVKLYSEEFYKLTKGKVAEDVPSTTVSIVRKRNGVLEFYSLGNSNIILQSKDNYIFSIIDPLNNIQDDINSAIFKNLSLKDNISIIETRQKYAEYVLQGRLRKNTFGGYYTLSNSEHAIEHGIYNSIPLELVSKVLILSDGYSQVYDLMGFLSKEQLINKVNCYENAVEVYNTLCAMQEGDKGGDKYIRFKFRDDASIVCMEF